MTTKQNYEVTNIGIFAAAKAVGGADSAVMGKINALSDVLKPHVQGMTNADATAWFQKPAAKGNGGGKAIRLDVLNGYCEGRNIKGGYALADATMQAMARKCFQRALEKACPKPLKPAPKAGGATSGEVNEANAENEPQPNESRQHSETALQSALAPVFAFLKGPALEGLIEAAKGNVAGGKLSTWVTSIRAAQEAVEQLNRLVNR